MSGTRPEGDEGDVAGADGVDQLKEVSEGLRATLSSSTRLSPKAGESAAAFRSIAELGRGREPPLNQPLAVALGPDGRVLVLDRPTPDRFRLGTFGLDGEALQSVVEFGKGRGDDELLEPVGLTVDQHGQVFFPDARGNCVKKFSPDGRWLATFESAGSDGAPFNSPRDVAVDDAGNLTVADTNNNRVVGLQPDGEVGWVLDRFGLPGGGGDEEEFYEPYSVCLAGGRLWVADTNNNRVLAFDSQRRPLDVQINGPFVLPSGVRAGAAGGVYVADHGNLRVQRFDGAGNQTGLLTITPRLVDNVAVPGGGEMDVTAEGHVVMVNPLRESVAIVAFVGP